MSLSLSNIVPNEIKIKFADSSFQNELINGRRQDEENRPVSVRDMLLAKWMWAYDEKIMAFDFFEWTKNVTWQPKFASQSRNWWWEKVYLLVVKQELNGERKDLSQNQLEGMYGNYGLYNKKWSNFSALLIFLFLHKKE